VIDEVVQILHGAILARKSHGNMTRMKDMKVVKDPT
jgi:hypothetical protein